MSENWNQFKGSDNPILNTIGNICGRISFIFLKPYIWWGTIWEWDATEDIDKEDLDI